MNSNSTTKYCDLSKFSANYRNSHGYLALLVCLFGSIANSLNICVLSAKEMRVPTNFILTGLAVSDLLVMLEYIPYSIHVYFDPIARMRPDYFSYPWAVYTYFHALFTQICHFISICLTVMLAIWRYVAITHPQNNKIWCNPKRTKIGIILSYILCPFICTPLFLGLIIKEYPRQTYPNGTIIQMTDNVTYEGNRTNVVIYALYFHDSYENINLWMYGVVIKLLPCILLTVLSVFLIKALLDAKKRWKTLSHSSGVPLVNSEKKQKDIEKNHQVDRTTRMLLAVLLLFLLTEFPQAMLGLISGILGHDFYNYCYMPLGDLMDMAALANSAINFILYCSMSQQFRTEFHKIFVKKCLRLCGRDKNVPSETNSHTKITVL